MGRTALPPVNVPFGVAVADESFVLSLSGYEELISALNSLVASVVDRDWLVGALSVKVKGYGLRSVLNGI